MPRLDHEKTTNTTTLTTRQIARYSRETFTSGTEIFFIKVKTGSLFKQNAKSRQCEQKRVAVSAQTNEEKLEHGDAKPNWVIETTDGWVGYEPQTENRQGQETLEGIGNTSYTRTNIICRNDLNFPVCSKGKSTKLKLGNVSARRSARLISHTERFIGSLLDFSSSCSWRHNSQARKQFPSLSTWQRRLQYQLKNFAQWVMRVVLPELTQWNGAKFSGILLSIYRVVQ